MMQQGERYESADPEYIEELYSMTLEGNNTDSYRCTAITNNLMRHQQWLPVDCDRHFENVAFICEVPQGIINMW